MRKFRIALTKGRLEDKIVGLFENAGLDCDELINKGRKLVLSLPDIEADVVLAKAADVITYVEQGACDVGIVGKDTILEHGGSYYEIMDLGFGACRFILAAKEDNDLFSGWRRLRIASKYPEITRGFFAKKGMDVEIIKIEGSVELAPLLGVADAIIDITETGSTLRENGLVIVEDVCDISARLIVNAVAMKMRQDEVDRLVGLLTKKD